MLNLASRRVREKKPRRCTTPTLTTGCFPSLLVAPTPKKKNINAHVFLIFSKNDPTGRNGPRHPPATVVSSRDTRAFDCGDADTPCVAPSEDGVNAEPDLPFEDNLDSMIEVSLPDDTMLRAPFLSANTPPPTPLDILKNFEKKTKHSPNKRNILYSTSAVLKNYQKKNKKKP